MSLRRIGRFARPVVRWTARIAVATVFAFAIAWVAFPFPLGRLDRPVSPIVTDRDGGPLLQLVASDDQWRMPLELEDISPWLVSATIAAEDKRFYDHLGVDPLAVLRAAGQNLRARSVVSGASTLTMQICRMMDSRPRTLWAKIAESFRALQLERLWSKNDILLHYLNVAPYGRNFCGVGAAAWGYFGKPARELSLGEASLLAGMPQSPQRLRPDRYPAAASERRRYVLDRMTDLGMISARQRDLAAAEPITLTTCPRTIRAPHAAFLALRRRPCGGRTAIDPAVQAELHRLAAARAAALPAGADVAAVAIHIPNARIVAMLGSLDAENPAAGQVNGALAWRSPGSALKPFVYAAAFEARRLAPNSIVHDVPIHRAGWSPRNFDRKHRGQVTADDALRRSLNVPAILTAEAIGLDRCIGIMRAAGVRFRQDAVRRGGLGVAVGTIEVRLLDVTNAFATLARGGVRITPKLFCHESDESDESDDADAALSPETCAAINEILSSRRRRPRGAENLPHHRVPWFMWKTGTSSARRDAWAVGHNGRYAVGVWVGRLAGSGDAAFVGARAAEPLLVRFFLSPALRRPQDSDPPPAPTWLVRRPLGEPAELAAPPLITAPAEGATFLAIAGSAIVRPRTNRTPGLTWFLNGMHLPPAAAGRLVLRPGRYELRCVDPAGAASAVRFAVR